MNGEDVKLNLIERLSSAGIIGIYDISGEGKIRVVIENASGGNALVIRGRIKGQTNFVNLKTLSGSDNQTVSVGTYDEIQIECTAYASVSNYIRVLAASFNDAGGSAIEMIGVPTGSSLTDLESMSFTSSDNSVVIIGDNITKAIDLKVSPTFGGAHVEEFVIADWLFGSGQYSYSIPQSTHLKGAVPKIQLFEKIGSDYHPVICEMDIDVSGNILILTNSTPDLRFDGRVIIF
jgi:hypothetical protein